MDKKKIDYCICHKFLVFGQTVEYIAIDTQTHINYDGVDTVSATSMTKDVFFLCCNCSKQMPEKVADKVFL